MFGAVPRSVVRASARRFTSKTLARPTSDLARSCRRGHLVSGENLGGYEKDWRGDSCYGWKRDQGAAWRGLSTAPPPSKGGPPEKDQKDSTQAPPPPGGKPAETAKGTMASSKAEWTPAPPPPEDKPAEPTGFMAKLKSIGWADKFKRHGPVFLVYWNGMWLLTGATIFGVIEYKVLGDVDAIQVARMIHLDRFINLDNINPTGGNLALTIAINEAFELVRLPFVLATLPYVTRWWESVRPASWAPKPEDPTKPHKPTFREMVVEHGPVFVCYWAALWALGLGGAYATLEYQLLGPGMDAHAVVEMLNLGQIIDMNSIDPRFPNLMVALAINELLELIRLPLAVGTVTRITRRLQALKLHTPSGYAFGLKQVQDCTPPVITGFSHIIEKLAKDYSIVTFDAYGCGESPKPEKPKEAYSTEELLLDLQVMYERYEGRRNLLLGHSFGSSQVMRLTAWLERDAERRARLMGMVLLASALHMPKGGHPVFNLPLPLFSLLQPVVSAIFKGRALTRHVDSKVAQDNTRVNTHNPSYMVKHFYNQFKWAEVSIISSLTAPSLVVHGESDGITTLDNARRLVQHLKGSVLHVLRHTGHQVMQEQPEQTLELILFFLDRVSRGDWPPREQELANLDEHAKPGATHVFTAGVGERKRVGPGPLQEAQAQAPPHGGGTVGSPTRGGVVTPPIMTV